MSDRDIGVLQDRLSDRDTALVKDVDKYRLLTSKQIQRLHFADHITPLAAARATSRALQRLRTADILRTLDRRIGGVRAGSAGFVWFIGPIGDRLLRALAGRPEGSRRNYREPTRHFVDHTLAVAELAVQAIEAGRVGDLEVLEVQTEPANWQRSLSKHGTVAWLKPDLHLVTARGAYEHHWFVEADLATEHLPVIRRQCAAYLAFRATGRYEAAHGLFPVVLWVTPTSARAALLKAAMAATKAPWGLFQVCTQAELKDVLQRGASRDAPPGPVPP